MGILGDAVAARRRCANASARGVGNDGEGGSRDRRTARSAVSWSFFSCVSCHAISGSLYMMGGASILMFVASKRTSSTGRNLGLLHRTQPIPHPFYL